MAFTLITGARHSLAPPSRAGMVTTPQASRHATDRIVAPPYRALDAGLRPGPFPDRAASLLPGLLAATRTGLSPAGDDELTNTKEHHGITSRCHLLPYWAHIIGHYPIVSPSGRGTRNRTAARGLDLVVLFLMSQIWRWRAVSAGSGNLVRRRARRGGRSRRGRRRRRGRLPAAGRGLAGWGR